MLLSCLSLKTWLFVPQYHSILWWVRFPMNIGHFVLSCVCSCHNNFREFTLNKTFYAISCFAFPKNEQAAPKVAVLLVQQPRGLSCAVPGCCQWDLTALLPAFPRAFLSLKYLGTHSCGGVTRASHQLVLFKQYFPRAQSTFLPFLKQHCVQSSIRGFPDERPALHSSITCLVNDLEMEDC